MSTTPTVKYAEKAESDIFNIIEFTVQRWGKIQAHTHIDDIQQLVKSLAEHPGLGKICNDLHDELMAFPCKSHVIYYLKEPHSITIVRVLHNSMNPDLHFKIESGAW